MSTKSALAFIRTSLKKQWLTVIGLSVAAVISIGLLTGLTLFTNRVYVTDGNEVKSILTAQDDAYMILAENDYKIGADDEIEFSGFENGTGNITIYRSFDISVTADGETKKIPATENKTVEQVLAEAEISVGDDDLLNMGLSEKANPNTDIVIQRVVIKDEIHDSPIPFDEIRTETANEAVGTTVITKDGQYGLLRTTKQNTYIDGVLTESRELYSQTLREPVTQEVSVGICPRDPIAKIAPEGAVEFDSNGKPLNYKTVLTGKATAYSARKGAKTASGRYAIVGHVAVDPKIIPYGTKMYIASTNGKHVYGYCVAADTGIALMDGRVLVDLFFGSYEESCRWGAKQVNIYILED